MVKAVALFSGGLDSMLAVKMVAAQGVDITLINFRLGFESLSAELGPARLAKKLGFPFIKIDLAAEFFELVKDPHYGYGSNLNPCIDCRILTLKKAVALMRETAASFLITGEVVAQRPMSQRKNILRLIEKQAQVVGLVLRPLSAKILDPTIAEQQGWVNRDELLDLQGRSRKRQLSLAAGYGIEDYLSPAGGCLLTDSVFAQKMRQLFSFDAKFGLLEVDLLKLGRHFRLSPRLMMVIGRNREENNRLQSKAITGDTILELVDIPGPLALLRGEVSAETIKLALGIMVRYSKGRHKSTVNGRYLVHPDSSVTFIAAIPLSNAEAKPYQLYDL